MAALVVHVCTLCGSSCACLWMNFKHMHLTARFQHIHTFDKFTLAIISRMLQKRWKFICYLYFCVQWNSPKQLHAYCAMSSSVQVQWPQTPVFSLLFSIYHLLIYCSPVDIWYERCHFYHTRAPAWHAVHAPTHSSSAVATGSSTKTSFQG